MEHLQKAPDSIREDGLVILRHLQIGNSPPYNAELERVMEEHTGVQVVSVPRTYPDVFPSVLPLSRRSTLRNLQTRSAEAMDEIAETLAEKGHTRFIHNAPSGSVLETLGMIDHNASVGAVIASPVNIYPRSWPIAFGQWLKFLVAQERDKPKSQTTEEKMGAKPLAPPLWTQPPAMLKELYLHRLLYSADSLIPVMGSLSLRHPNKPIEVLLPEFDYTEDVDYRKHVANQLNSHAQAYKTAVHAEVLQGTWHNLGDNLGPQLPALLRVIRAVSSPETAAI